MTVGKLLHSSTCDNSNALDMEKMERLAASHARRLARQRARRQAEVRIDYRPGRAAQRVLRHYQTQGLQLDAIIDSLVLAAGIRPITKIPEAFRKP